MKAVAEWDAAIGVLRRHKGQLILIIEDWNNGLTLKEGPGDQLAMALEGLKARYGVYFSWRAFGGGLDVWWCREGGIIAEGPGEDAATLHAFLETDWRRFPGVKVLRGTQVKVAIETGGEGGPQLRLIALLEEDSAEAAETQHSGA